MADSKTAVLRVRPPRNGPNGQAHESRDGAVLSVPIDRTGVVHVCLYLSWATVNIDAQPDILYDLRLKDLDVIACYGIWIRDLPRGLP